MGPVLMKFNEKESKIPRVLVRHSTSSNGGRKFDSEIAEIVSLGFLNCYKVNQYKIVQNYF